MLRTFNPFLYHILLLIFMYASMDLMYSKAQNHSWARFVRFVSGYYLVKVFDSTEFGVFTTHVGGLLQDIRFRTLNLYDSHRCSCMHAQYDDRNDVQTTTYTENAYNSV